MPISDSMLVSMYFTLMLCATGHFCEFTMKCAAVCLACLKVPFDFHEKAFKKGSGIDNGFTVGWFKFKRSHFVAIL